MYRYSYPRPSYNKPLAFLIAFCALAVFLAGCSPTAQVPDESEQDSSLPSEQYSVYFSESTAAATDCSMVTPVPRELENVESLEDRAQALMETLLAGPTEEEAAEGYTSFFTLDTAGALRDIVIRDGTVYIDLEDIRDTIPNASSSCGSAQMMAQVDSTLMQLPGVDRVILAIDGNTQTFYDWIQIGCGPQNDNCDNSAFTAEGDDQL